MFPQAPQFVALLRMSTSQPFASIPSQFAKPALQLAMPHTPAVHEGVALGTEQAFPQAPQ
jgi:hypothetical protein